MNKKERKIEIIVTNKQTAFFRAKSGETRKKFPQPKFKLINPTEGIEI